MSTNTIDTEKTPDTRAPQPKVSANPPRKPRPRRKRASRRRRPARQPVESRSSRLAAYLPATWLSRSPHDLPALSGALSGVIGALLRPQIRDQAVTGQLNGCGISGARPIREDLRVWQKPTSGCRRSTRNTNQWLLNEGTSLIATLVWS